MELINLAYAIYNKNGTVAVPATPISTLLVNAGLPNFGTGLSDPRIAGDLFEQFLKHRLKLEAKQHLAAQYQKAGFVHCRLQLAFECSAHGG